MAYSFSKYSFSPLFTLLLLFSLLVSAKAAADLIGQVCAKTQNPTTCEQALRNDPRSAKADIKGLGFISIDLAQAGAKQTSTLIASLLKGITDPVLKGRYSTCAEVYGDMVDDLNDGRQALNAGDYEKFRAIAAAALDEPDTCEEGFEGPPAETPELKKANKKVSGLAEIVVAVGASLSASS